MFVKKIKAAVEDWARQYPQVELSVIEAYPSGIGENVHVIIVAQKGFENWRQLARQKDLEAFLRKRLGDAESAKIPLLLTLTEEEFDRYEITKPVGY
jgi:acid stress-induced BolA-like protein IbaG/YrbA